MPRRSERYLAAQPRIAGIGVAREALPGMGERMILHAGPPIAWERMCGPMQGAIVGAILYEGWAADAQRRRGAGAPRRGRLRALPPPRRGRADGRHHQPVDAGVDRATTAVHGNRAYSNLNEGLGKVLRFGANGPEVHRAAEMDGRDAGADARKRRSMLLAVSSSSR